MELIRSISGIRGIIGKNFNPSIAASYAESFCHIQSLYNTDSKPIIISRDTRNQGDEISDAIKESLTSLGLDIYDIGIAPTPVIQHLVNKLKCGAGIMITASHNPEEWNGLKFIDSDGCFIESEKNQKLFTHYDKILGSDNKETETLAPIKNKKGSITDKTYAIDSFIDDLFSMQFINIEQIKSKKFKVVIDAINGANYQLLPNILNQLNCEVIPLFCDNSGKFERNPEPIAKNLDILSKKVIQHNADIGLACDPDGDRLSIVDEKGTPIGEEATLVLCSDDYYNETKSKTPLITNLSSTMALDYIAKKHNVKIFRSPVGEANVIKLMKEKKSLIGGEGNGGVIMKDFHLGRDSLIATMMILNKLSKGDKFSLSESIKDVPKYYMVKSKIPIPVNINLKKLYDFLIKEYPEVIFDTQDGLKLIWNNKWVHIRSSNTEPIIRIIGEALTPNKINHLIEKTINNINNFIIEN